MTAGAVPATAPARRGSPAWCWRARSLTRLLAGAGGRSRAGGRRPAGREPLRAAAVSRVAGAGRIVLHLSIQDGRLVFDIRRADDAPLIAIGAGARAVPPAGEGLPDAGGQPHQGGRGRPRGAHPGDRHGTARPAQRGRGTADARGCAARSTSTSPPRGGCSRWSACCTSGSERAAMNDRRRPLPHHLGRSRRRLVASRIIDQTKLPWALEIVRLTDVDAGGARHPLHAGARRAADRRRRGLWAVPRRCAHDPRQRRDGARRGACWPRRGRPRSICAGRWSGC